MRSERGSDTVEWIVESNGHGEKKKMYPVTIAARRRKEGKKGKASADPWKLLQAPCLAAPLRRFDGKKKKKGAEVEAYFGATGRGKKGKTARVPV